MDTNNIITAAFGLMAIYNVAMTFIMNRFFKLTDTIREENRNLWEELSRNKDEMARNYVRRDDYLSSQSQILSMLRRIEDKIEKKQDKS